MVEGRERRRRKENEGRAKLKEERLITKRSAKALFRSAVLSPCASLLQLLELLEPTR